MNQTPGRRAFMARGIAAGIGMPMLGGGLTVGTIANAATDWPARPVRLVCGFAAGGLTDMISRTYCADLQAKYNQTFIVENKAGAGSILACQEIAKAAPDGYNLLYTIGTAIIQNPVLYSKLPYDPVKDFTSLALMMGGGLPLCVNPKLPIRNIAEFVAYARANPVNLGTYAAGSYPHMFTAQMNKRFGLSIEAVHYKGEGPMWQDVASGATQCGMGSFASVQPRLQAGSVRPVAVMGKERLSRIPDVPTMAEQGVTERAFALTTYHMILGPAGMAPDLRDRISNAIVETARKESIRRTLEVAGSDVRVNHWQVYEQTMKEETPIIQGVLRELNVRLD